MKILHSADWHLGHSLYNFDRTEEHTALFHQLADIVALRQPDLFLLSGDLYHTPHPSTAVQTLFSDALVRIHQACPQMTIVVTAGNHDSGARHEIFRTPWQALNVHTIGQLDRENLDSHIVEVPGKGWLAALPYTSERNLPQEFFQQLLDRVAQRNTEGLPVVLSAHTTVRGCDFTGHDHATEYSVGGIDSLDLEQLGVGYDYLALGHIHHAQYVHSGHHNVYYSGSPLPVSFDETYPHSVALVEIGKHGETPQLETIPIDNPHPLVTLPADGFLPWDQAKQLLAEFPDDIPAYIRLNVEVDDFLPVEAHSEALALAQGKQCRFCYINVRKKTSNPSETPLLSVEEFQTEEPIELAKRYASDLGIDFDNEMATMFNEVVTQVTEEDRK